MREDPFETLIYDQLQVLFSYLSIKDISALACTCTHFANQVEIHWKYECKRNSMEHALAQYFSTQLLLKNERQIYDTLKSGEYTFRWLYTQGSHKRSTRRISSRRMGYNIIGSPTWLCFQFFYTFPQVLPGRYAIKLNIKTSTVKRIAQQYPKLKISWDDRCEQYDVVAIVAKMRWKRFGRVFKGKSVKLDKCFSFNYDKDNGSCDFCFDNLLVASPSDVTIEFTHIVSNEDKAKVFTDYVEIVPV